MSIKTQIRGVSIGRLVLFSLLALEMLALPLSVNAQGKKSITVSGTITDASTGEPSIGAGVMLKASNVGTITDLDGTYLIKVNDSKGILVISAIGYKTQEIRIDGRSTIDVALEPDMESLEDAVVIGYGTQKKATVTGALTVVNTEIVGKATTPTLANALGGTVPGIISRQRSGEPGYDGATLLIRGAGTWLNSSPLVLVDGIERDINLINTDEIESFSILKDASATAVYGMRGANGVILINTKKGTAGKPRVSFRSESSLLHGLRFPNYIKGWEFATLMNEACETGGVALPWSDEEIELFRDGSDPYNYPSVDWTDAVLKKNAFQTINTVSVSGGNEIVRYYVSAGFSSESGLFKEDPAYNYRTNSLSQRYNFRTNVDVNVTKNFTLTLGLAEIVENRTYPGTPAGDIFWSLKVVNPITYPIRNPDGSFGSSNTSYEKNSPYVLTTNNGFSKQFRSTTQGTFGAKWDLGTLITPGLVIEGNFAYDHYYSVEATRRKQPELKKYLGPDPVTGEDRYNVIQEEGTMGYYLAYNVSNRSYYADARINYDRVFNGHGVSALLMANLRDYSDLTAGNSTAQLPYRRQGFAGRLAYNYRQRYLFEVNAGYNGSENFAPGHRYGFFPAVSAGWVPSEEKWWNVSFIDHLKIRGSYGTVGNDSLNAQRFFYMSTINKNANGYTFSYDQSKGIGGVAESRMGSPLASWEVSNKADVGLDLEMFDRKLRLSGDYFYEHRTNILLERGSVPRTIGLASNQLALSNIGIMDNTGFDANIEFTNTTSYGLYYQIRGNVTYAHNTVIEDDTAQALWSYQNTRGKSIGIPLGYIALGLFQSQEEIDNSPKQELGTYTVGDIKYKDVNNDGVINPYDRVFIGYAREPEIMYGFGFTVAWKGFDVSANFTGAANATILLDAAGMWPFQLDYPGYNIYREYYDNRFIPGADNTNALYPVVHNGTSTNNYQINTLYLHDSSFLKLKTAEVGYSFPRKITSRIGLEKLRLFINGNNLLCFDGLKGIVDPESNHLGASTYPTQLAATIGIEVGF